MTVYICYDNVKGDPVAITGILGEATRRLKNTEDMMALIVEMGIVNSNFSELSISPPTSVIGVESLSPAEIAELEAAGATVVTAKPELFKKYSNRQVRRAASQPVL